MSEQNKVYLSVSIIKYYELYRNPNFNKLKLNTVNEIKFVLDERYEIIE